MCSEQNIIEQFYEAFQKADAEKMTNCYHDEVVFEDPAFGILEGDRAKNMWRMLCESSKDLKIEISNVKIKNDSATAHWEAHYTFSRTGRKVHNIIDATFKLKDGKIVEHIDTFNLHKWAKQALGLKGTILGGTSFFREKLNTQVNNLLTKYEKKITSKK